MNMIISERKIYSTDSNGNKKEYDVIMTFRNEDNGKYYAVYTDNTYDNENKLKIYSCIYNPDNYKYIGLPESESEFELIYKLLGDVLLEKANN